MTALLLATGCAGLFAGAAIYVTFVEHPARMAEGSAIAVREFGPSYNRGKIMQAAWASSLRLAAASREEIVLSRIPRAVAISRFE